MEVISPSSRVKTFSPRVHTRKDPKMQKFSEHVKHTPQSDKMKRVQLNVNNHEAPKSPINSNTASKRTKKAKIKGVKHIKLETYLKHNPIFRNKDLRVGFLACRREIAFILSKIKLFVRKDTEQTRTMLGNFFLKQSKLFKLLRIWYKQIKKFQRKKEFEKFQEVYGIDDGKKVDDTFTWTHLSELEDSDDS